MQNCRLQVIFSLFRRGEGSVIQALAEKIVCAFVCTKHESYNLLSKAFPSGMASSTLLSLAAVQLQSLELTVAIANRSNTCCMTSPDSHRIAAASVHRLVHRFSVGSSFFSTFKTLQVQVQC